MMKGRRILLKACYQKSIYSSIHLALTVFSYVMNQVDRASQFWKKYVQEAIVNNAFYINITYLNHSLCTLSSFLPWDYIFHSHYPRLYTQNASDIIPLAQLSEVSLALNNSFIASFILFASLFSRILNMSATWPHHRKKLSSMSRSLDFFTPHAILASSFFAHLFF